MNISQCGWTHCTEKEMGTAAQLEALFPCLAGVVMIIISESFPRLGLATDPCRRLYFAHKDRETPFEAKHAVVKGVYTGLAWILILIGTIVALDADGLLTHPAVWTWPVACVATILAGQLVFNAMVSDEVSSKVHPSRRNPDLLHWYMATSVPGMVVYTLGYMSLGLCIGVAHDERHMIFLSFVGQPMGFWLIMRSRLGIHPDLWVEVLGGFFWTLG